MHFYHLATFALLISSLAGCAHEQPFPAMIPTTLPACPAITEQVLGTTMQGRPISMIRFGTAAPVVLVMAGIHGDESSSVYVADQLVATLRASPRIVEPGSVAIIPRANPDGVARGSRVNARGVDLNRNFPASNWAATRRGAYHGGSTPQSEPETAALVRTIRELKPRLIISIHSITRGLECNNYDGPAAELAEAMSQLNRYPAKAAIGYPTPGSLGSWAGIDEGIAVITLELPRHLSGEQAWQANREALLVAIGVKPERAAQ